jgi:predicted membrane chloride channel (bestrophin family)
MVALTLGLETAQNLAITRAQTIASLEQSLSSAHAALREAETAAAERLAQLAATEEQLHRTAAAFAHAEKLALERFAEIKELSHRIRDLQSLPPNQESAR